MKTYMRWSLRYSDQRLACPKAKGGELQSVRSQRTTGSRNQPSPIHHVARALARHQLEHFVFRSSQEPELRKQVEQVFILQDPSTQTRKVWPEMALIGIMQLELSCPRPNIACLAQIREGHHPSFEPTRVCLLPLSVIVWIFFASGLIFPRQLATSWFQPAQLNHFTTVTLPEISRSLLGTKKLISEPKQFSFFLHQSRSSVLLLIFFTTTNYLFIFPNLVQTWPQSEQ